MIIYETFINLSKKKIQQNCREIQKNKNWKIRIFGISPKNWPGIPNFGIGIFGIRDSRKFRDLDFRDSGFPNCRIFRDSRFSGIPNPSLDSIPFNKLPYLQVQMAKTALSWVKPLHPLKDFLILLMVHKVALEGPKVAQNFPLLDYWAQPWQKAPNPLVKSQMTESELYF